MRKSVIIGYVMIPSGVDRDSYVKYSIRTQTACVMTQDGDFNHESRLSDRSV